MQKTFDRSLASNPAGWYGMMRKQVLDYEESTVSDWFKGLSVEQKRQHWYAGALLASDLLRAADAALAAKPKPGIFTRLWQKLFGH